MNKEPITLHLETFNNEEYILADECIEAIGLHRRTNTELHQTIEEKDKEIERLKEIIRQLDIKNLELTTIINKLEEYMRSDDGWDVENILNYLQELKVNNEEKHKIEEVMSVEELESYESKSMAEQEYQDWFWEGNE